MAGPPGLNKNAATVAFLGREKGMRKVSYFDNLVCHLVFVGPDCIMLSSSYLRWIENRLEKYRAPTWA